MMLACTSGLPDNDNRQKPQGEGEPVELSFKLYEASLTKALGATTLVDLDPGTKFTVLAYKAGTAVDASTQKLPEPLGKSVCTIADDKTADGNMSLYRGEYADNITFQCAKDDSSTDGNRNCQTTGYDTGNERNF